MTKNETLKAFWDGRERNGSLTGEELSLLTDSLYDAGVAQAIEDCKKKIQADCGACGGSGGVAVGEHYVTRDMALDAGDPSLEGASMGVEYQQCEYCGRPMASLDELAAKLKEKP